MRRRLGLALLVCTISILLGTMQAMAGMNRFTARQSRLSLLVKGSPMSRPTLPGTNETGMLPRSEAIPRTLRGLAPQVPVPFCLPFAGWECSSSRQAPV